ncbi:heterokaryon incompatibility protein-domain-containing protein [Daldinia caldariorum]|uniref:heterokaryon incompatibility protein-domain-containing protein n=1 Tax=Daldinia caldariorum TaxID=326644 RepID=UPI0020085F29|nr:heterokaryon incompatibility protein-domain-containing protein [Daldinia caldariorum]KAI1465527.1 heterokaryon incompatibility protein-domain-containing protein [Daldinia caldariorum]
MWLINTTTLELEFVASPTERAYAVLSHTWEDEEVSFQQFSDTTQRASVEKLRGFTKIVKTCQLAKDEHMLKYAWVDTCCIDKTSSAELSEAINCMFRWYQQAAVCFVWLCDMALEPIDFWDTSPGPYKRVTPDVLRECKWTTRGWTLQELLAPSVVKFYDRNWDFIGTKDSWLLDPISEVTGIEPEFLTRNYLIWSAPVGTRVRWASGRKTTRPEDIAYCLLGIFDINMPLLYGEGDKAFLRLQEEICKQTHDLSLFAWTARPGYASSSLFDRYRGIFALHPCEFSDTQPLQRESASSVFRGEVAITNKGLRLDDVQLYRAPNDTLILPLGYAGPCSEDKYRKVSYGIYIRLTLDGYIRKNPGTLAILSGDRTSDIPTHRIYIRKQSVAPWVCSELIRDKYIGVLLFRFEGQFPSRMVKVIPQESFDYSLNAFITGGEKFFGYLRLSVGGVEVVVVCWLRMHPSKYSTTTSPDVKYGFAVEGKDGWDRLKTMRLETEIANHAGQDGTVLSLQPNANLSHSDGSIVTSLGSSDISMAMHTFTRGQNNHLMVTFMKKRKRTLFRLPYIR